MILLWSSLKHAMKLDFSFFYDFLLIINASYIFKSNQINYDTT